MKIEVRVEEGCTEPKLIILTGQMTQEIQDLVRRLGDLPPATLTGFREELAEVLDPVEILRVYAQAGKVLAETGRGTYQLRLRLYEAEQRLDSRSFARISNSEILNLKKVQGFDLSFTGTIRVLLLNGESTYVSRRYVGKIKKILGI